MELELNLDTLTSGKTSKYVILLKETGKPLCVRKEHNGRDRYACGEHTYTLTDDGYHPVFMLDELDKAILALSFDTGWYNSTAERPCHGKFEKEDMEVGLLEVTTSLSRVQTEDPLIIDSKAIVDTYSKPWVIAKKLVAGLEKRDSYTVVLTKGLDPEVLKKYVGFKVFFGSEYNRRTLLGFAPAREEHQEFGDMELVCTHL